MPHTINLLLDWYNNLLGTVNVLNASCTHYTIDNVKSNNGLDRYLIGPWSSTYIGSKYRGGLHDRLILKLSSCPISIKIHVILIG